MAGDILYNWPFSQSDTFSMPAFLESSFQLFLLILGRGSQLALVFAAGGVDVTASTAAVTWLGVKSK